MIKKITLSNGTRIIMEPIPALDTVSLGFWFSTGSANETKEENGYTHFIEHMLFKGTKELDSKEIIKQIEGVGGIFNAFTSRHFTSFYISIISKYFDRAFNILTDIISNSAFREIDISREKKVIIEEIKMSNDTPEELVGQQFFANAYKGTAMSFPIAGSISNIKNIDKKCVYSYFKNRFNSKNLIISIAGKFDIESIEKKLSQIKIEEKKESKWDELPFFYKTKVIEKPDLNQVYFALISPSFNALDKRNYTINAVNDIFGGSSYSRLFQTIRENKGLCYNIYSYNSSFINGGTFEIHGSTSLERYKETIESIYKEIEILLEKRITETELEEAKETYKSTIAFSKLNAEFIMNKNARHEYYFKRHIPFKEMYSMINKINMKSANEIIDILLSKKKFFLTAVGPKGTKEISDNLSKSLNLN